MITDELIDLLVSAQSPSLDDLQRMLVRLDDQQLRKLRQTSSWIESAAIAEDEDRTEGRSDHGKGFA